MAHQRKLIRNAVAAALSGATDADSRVFPTREAPFRSCELPALAVYGVEESVDIDSRQTSPRELARTLSLAVLLVVSLNEAVDDALDDLAEQVERAMEKDETFGGQASDAMLVSTEIGVDEKGARPVGWASLTFSIWYYTPAPLAADQPLDDLRTVDVVTAVQGAPGPEDRVEVAP